MVEKKVLFPELKAEMARNGETAMDIMALIGCSYHTVSNKMTKVCDFKAKEISILCKHYKKSPEFLFPEFFD